MKSVGELMQELGFNKNSSLDVQKAFVKNLIQAAAEAAPAPTPIHVGQPKPAPLQLEFDFNQPEDTDKKVS